MMTDKWPVQKVAQPFCRGRDGTAREIPAYQTEFSAFPSMVYE
jgi:hypothetical protein